MARVRLVTLLLASALVTSCAKDEPGRLADPCALRARGAAWLAYATKASGSWDVAVMRADGTCARVVADRASDDLDPAWAPSAVLAYASTRPPLPSVWIQDLTTGDERRLDVGATLRAASPAFSPDGGTIAFEGRYVGSTTSSIYLVPAAGGVPVELTPEAVAHGNGGPVFSPDGADVYFVSDRNGAYAGDYDVFRVAARVPAATPEQVTTGSGIVGRPAISADGATLAYATSIELVLRDLASGVETPLDPGASEPAFDPAGGRLAAVVLQGGRKNLALVPLSGGAATPLTSGVGPDGAPAFAPLGP
jgi:TolB protein